jgi:hypothetical protein
VLTALSEVLVEPAYAGENVASDPLQQAVPQTITDTLKNQRPATRLRDAKPNGEDLEDTANAGDFFALINPELSHNWQKNSAGNINSALKFELYSLLGLQISDKLDFKLEATLNTQADGDYLALKKPLLEIESLALAYKGDLLGLGLGLGIGKFNLLNEADMVSPIWSREESFFNSLPNDNLDLSGAIGVRAWFNFDEIIDKEHYLYMSLFYLDDTRLAKPFINKEINDKRDFTGVGYTGKLNNWMLSMHGELPVFNKNWSYSFGTSRLQATSSAHNSEQSYFAGVYGDYELPSKLSLLPYIELLYQDGVQGGNQKLHSGLAGIAFENDEWLYGASLSYRHHKDMDLQKITNDKEAQFFISYNYQSGAYLDFGYQYLRKDNESNQVYAIALGMPFDFNASLYGEGKAPSSNLKRKDIKRVIRKIKPNS